MNGNLQQRHKTVELKITIQASTELTLEEVRAGFASVGIWDVFQKGQRIGYIRLENVQIEKVQDLEP